MAFDPDAYLSQPFDPDAYLAAQSAPAQAPQPQATAGSEMRGMSRFGRQLPGFAAPMVETYYGAKQLLKGGLDPDEQANLASWKQISGEAPIESTIAGTVAPMLVGGAGLLKTGVQGVTRVGQAMLAPKSIGQAAGVAGGYMGLQPVEGEGVGVGERILKAGGGALTGAGGYRIATIAGSYLANKFGNRVAAAGSNDIDDSINAALKDSGQTITDLPPSYAHQLRLSVKASLTKGKDLDVRAAVRAKDFGDVGIEPTLGQVTRDPGQYATERNLRGVAGVGEPLLQRFTGQETALRGKISGLAKGATDRYQAGGQIGGALTKADDEMSKRVHQLYLQARQSSGKDLELPLEGLAQDYARILRDFGDKVPSGVRNNLDELGLLSGTQRKLFTVEDADRILKVINSNQSSDPAVNAALGQLRTAVKATVLAVDDTGGAFAPAVKAAAQRFNMHDMLPALRQAGRGEIDADKFVAKHIVGASPESVEALMKLLKTTDQGAYDQAKAQIGEYLRRAAYGINEAGDAGFRPAGFTKAIDSLGARLNVFYSPQEIAQIRQLSRVGSFMSAFPAQAAVSTSNSGVPVQNALMGLAETKLPGLSMLSNIAKNLSKSSGQKKLVGKAMAANIPEMPLGLSPGEMAKYQNSLSALMAPAGYSLPYMANQ